MIRTLSVQPNLQASMSAVAPSQVRALMSIKFSSSNCKVAKMFECWFGILFFQYFYFVEINKINNNNNNNNNNNEINVNCNLPASERQQRREYSWNKRNGQNIDRSWDEES
jgi:hypothetical protein